MKFTTPDFSLIEVSPFTWVDTAFGIGLIVVLLFSVIGFIFQSKLLVRFVCLSLELVLYSQ